jgi:uncharacterized membrane protein
MAQTVPPVDDAQPPAAEYTTIWVAYALHAAGAVGFFPGPVIGVIINYVKHDGAEAGFIGSHHRWLIRTFWWILAACVLCTGVIVAGLWPLVGELVHELIRSDGTSPQTISLDIRWESIVATVGAATAGGVGFVAAWIWYVYRMVRGGLLLADARPAP